MDLASRVRPFAERGVPRSVRARSTLAAVVVVAVALAVAAGALVLLLDRSQTASVRAAASQLAQTVAAQVAEQGSPTLSAESTAAIGPTQVVQLVDPTGRLLASSSARASEPLTTLRPGGGQELTQRLEDVRALGGGDAEVVARGIALPGGTVTALVVASVQEAREALATVGALLAAGYPFVVAVVGGAVSLLVGRTLRPVELMRRRAAGITAAGLHQRVPVPASGDEVARLAVTLNAMLDRLEGAQSAQRRFAADASHELRSPLSTVRAALEVSLDDPSQDTWRELAPVAMAQVDRMGRLVEDLLLLARTDESGLTIPIGDVDLDDLVQAEILRLRTRGVEAEGHLTPARTRGDARRLAQVLANLGDNAARHAHRRVQLALTVTARGQARIDVDDDGPGVPPEQRQRVFHRFVRLDDSRQRDSGGSGLGLSIVEEVVRAHGGSTACSAAPSGGARFTVWLPCTS